MYVSIVRMCMWSFDEEKINFDGVMELLLFKHSYLGQLSRPICIETV